MISGAAPALQQKWGRKIMYKLFAIICIMTAGELECTTYDDSEKQVFRSLKECDKQASYRFYGMAEVFDASLSHGTPWKLGVKTRKYINPLLRTKLLCQ